MKNYTVKLEIVDANGKLVSMKLDSNTIKEMKDLHNLPTKHKEFDAMKKALSDKQKKQKSKKIFHFCCL